MKEKPKYYFDKKKAGRPVRFFEKCLVYPTGNKAGQPFKLDPYQVDFTHQTNGWVETSTGHLKHGMCYLEVAKGNGKTPFMAGMAVYFCCADGIKNGEIYILAGDKRQAKIMHNDCKNMIKDSPVLADKFDIQRDLIIHKKSGTFIEVLSADADTKHGPRPDKIFIDELHVQPNSELYNTMVKALFKKDNSQCYMITTAGVINTFAETIHDYADNLSKGVLTNDAWYVKIYGADYDDNPFSIRTAKKANPGWGTIVDPHKFKKFAKTAQDIPSELNSFKRLHLNIWTGSENAWIPVEDWDKCNLNPVTLEDLAGRDCVAGLDLATVRDTCALVIASARPDDSGIIDILPYFWVPKNTAIKRTRTENINYMAWIDSGEMYATPGDAVDYEYIFTKTIEINEKVKINSLAYDRKFAASLIIPLVDAGIECTPFGQGMYSMSFPTKELEKMIINQKINHGGHPVLRWQANNAYTETDAADNIKLNKKKSKDKIDGIVATVMAIGEYLTNTEDNKLDDNFEFTIL